MNRPVVIVEPLSSGIELAPAFRARGIPAIAVTLKTSEWTGFGSKIRTSDFIEIIPDQPNLLEILKKFDPLAIIPGAEEGVPLAEVLALAMTPTLCQRFEEITKQTAQGTDARSFARSRRTSD